MEPLQPFQIWFPHTNFLGISINYSETKSVQKRMEKCIDKYIADVKTYPILLNIKLN